MTEEQPDNIRHAEKLKHISTAEDARYIRHHAKSVELIQYSASRGMSRGAMRKIWSDQLINMVLGHEAANVGAVRSIERDGQDVAGIGQQNCLTNLHRRRAGMFYETN